MGEFGVVWFVFENRNGINAVLERSAFGGCFPESLGRVVGLKTKAKAPARLALLVTDTAS